MRDNFKQKAVIVHVITGLKTGGAERMLSKLVCYPSSRKYKHYVVSLTGRGSQSKIMEEFDIPIFHLNMNKNFLNFVKNLFKIFMIITSTKPNVLMGWMYHSNIIIYIMKFFLDKKISYIWNIRHTPVNLNDERFITNILIRFKRYISKKVDVIIYNSNKSQEYHEKLGYYKNNSTVIPNGFDVKKFVISSSINLLKRKSLKIEKSTFVFGHVARYHPMKNHKMFIEVAKIITSKIQNVVFLMAGSNIDNENVALVNLIKKHKLDKHIILLGEISDLYNFYPTLDIFCLTSSWGESFPNVLGEAMSCGVPCVTTDIGDTSLIVGNQGKCVKPNDKDLFAKACLEIINIKNNTHLRLNRNVRKHIVENFKLEKIINKYHKVYESCNKFD